MSLPAVRSEAVVDFVAQTGLVAGLSGISAHLQGQINVVGGVAVNLYLINIPQHLRLLQTNILPLVFYGVSRDTSSKA